VFAVLKAVFFDFGGTLMDAGSDRRAHVEIAEKVKTRYGLEQSLDQIAREFDHSLFSYSPERAKRWVKSERIITEYFGHLVGEQLDTRWLWATYFDAHRRHCKLFPDAKPTIEQVRGLGLHTGIISDIDDEYFFFQTKQFSMDGMFDSITTSDEVGVGKPNPKIFEIALAKAGCDSRETVYIGDSLEKDIMGAKGVGMYTIWYRGSTSESADWIVQGLSEVPPIVTQLQRG
jgi:HAD superfamily hydrolase (TIGR01509 family)